MCMGTFAIALDLVLGYPASPQDAPGSAGAEPQWRRATDGRYGARAHPQPFPAAA